VVSDDDHYAQDGASQLPLLDALLRPAGQRCRPPAAAQVNERQISFARATSSRSFFYLPFASQQQQQWQQRSWISINPTLFLRVQALPQSLPFDRFAEQEEDGFARCTGLQKLAAFSSSY